MRNEPATKPQAPQPLTFAALDDRAMAGTNAGPLSHTPAEIGPQIELLLLSRQGVIPSLSPQGFPLLNHILSIATTNRLLKLGEHFAMLQLSRDNLPATEWTRMSIEAKRCALAAGFGNAVAGQLAVAVVELGCNIVEHSQAPETGLIAFRGTDNAFEFVAADQGVGSLATLRSNPKYSHLSSADPAPILPSFITRVRSVFGPRRPGL